jgi:hypothetical protein
MKRIAVTIGLMLWIVSCTPAVAPKTGYKSIASQNKIVYLRRDGQHATLNRYLKVVKELNKYDENGLFTGIVVFNNNRYKVKSSPNLVCDVQFVFLDEDGLEVEKTNWQPVLFPPGVDTTVKQVSLNQNTRDYKVYVREPKTPAW